jgi:hypothetical protein
MRCQCERLAARQQEIDRGRGRASAIDNSRIAKRLAIVPAFRMRLQPEPRDDVGGGQAVPSGLVLAFAHFAEHVGRRAFAGHAQGGRD